MAAKIIVTAEKGGSRISLLGSSGKELLGSVVFQEPRAKGATLRALKGIFGDVAIEDRTLRAVAKPAAKPVASAPAAVSAPAAPKNRAAASPAVVAVAPAPVEAKAPPAKRRSPAKAAKAKVTPKKAAVAPAAKVAAARKTTKAATARA